MSKRTSAAAVHAAKILMEHFNFSARPPEEVKSGRVDGILADIRCIAIVVDYATSAFEVANLRPELRYWQERLTERTATPSQLAAFLQKSIEAFDRLPKNGPCEPEVTVTLSTPREFRSAPTTVELSKAAREASRYLFNYYAIVPKRREPDEKLDRVRLATLAESALGIARASRAYPLMVDTKNAMRLGKLTEKEIRSKFRTLGILLEYLPNYENREEEVKLL